MLDGSIYTFVVPVGRTLAGFIIGIMLGIVGGWIAVIFNAMSEYPWALAVHQNIYLVGIGLGAGGGAYCGWMNLSLRWYLILGSLLLVLLAGIAGSYVGYIYGQHVDPSYLGRRYTIDNTIHFGAAVGGIAVAAALGLIGEIRSWGR
jgi:hypothetical protein